MNRIRDVLEALRASLWFVPALIVASAVALAIVLIEVDGAIDYGKVLQRWPRVFGVGADGARETLSAIAGSMATIAGVAFSITIVAFSLASSQYTSRILRNFMRDRGNQTVLGVFIGVFAYCLVVLRTIRGAEEGGFVPPIAVLVAMLLAFVAVGFFIFFIHHVSASIQASNIIQSAAEETLQAVDRLFPDLVGVEADEAAGDRNSADEASFSAVPARKTGYIQSVEADALLKIAREHELVVRMEKAVGEFVVEESALASISGAALNDGLIQKLNAAYTVGRHRTVHEDAGYGIRQIVDVALKALSPGINDTTTAVIAVDYLGAIVARLAARAIAAPRRSDGGKLRLITRSPTFFVLLDEAFDQIRQNAEGNVAALTRMLQTLEMLGPRSQNPHRRRALRIHAELITETAMRSIPSLHDRTGIQALGTRVTQSLDG